MGRYRNGAKVWDWGMSPACNLVIRSEPLQGGSANAGTYQHNLLTPHGKLHLSLIEKRLKRGPFWDDEASICRQLAAFTESGVNVGPLPQVLSVLTDDDHHLVLMRRYSNVWMRLQDSALHPRLTAHALHAVNQSPVTFPAENATEGSLLMLPEFARQAPDLAPLLRATEAACQFADAGLLGDEV